MWTSTIKEMSKLELIVPFSYILREIDPEDALVELNKSVQVFLIMPFLESILWSVEEEPVGFTLTMEFLISDRDVGRSRHNSRMELMESYQGLLGRLIKDSGVVYDFVTDITLKG